MPINAEIKVKLSNLSKSPKEIEDIVRQYAGIESIELKQCDTFYRVEELGAFFEIEIVLKNESEISAGITTAKKWMNRLDIEDRDILHLRRHADSSTVNKKFMSTH